MEAEARAEAAELQPAPLEQVMQAMIASCHNGVAMLRSAAEHCSEHNIKRHSCATVPLWGVHPTGDAAGPQACLCLSYQCSSSSCFARTARHLCECLLQQQ